MGSPRLPERPSPARRRATAPAALPPGADAPISARDVLLKSWPGRLFLISAALKLLVTPFRLRPDAPAVVDILGVAATIGLIVSVAYFLWRLVILMKRRLLWRVRRKLILSYIFMGVVPAALIGAFVLVAASMVSMNVSAYMFKVGYDNAQSDLELLAEAAANEVARAPRAAADTVERVHRNGIGRLPGLAMGFIPAGETAPPAVKVGRWDHGDMPAALPGWLRDPAGYRGTIVLAENPGEDVELILRTLVPARSPSGLVGHIVADVPVDSEMLQRVYDQTGVSGRGARLLKDSDASTPMAETMSATSESGDDGFALFRRSVTILDVRDWSEGRQRRAAVSLSYRLGELYRHIGDAQSGAGAGAPSVAQLILIGLLVIGVLFLIVQLVALIMGLALARSITSSIHELFMGTERVRHGDFTHRIDIPTKDQLGELADSFNQMTGSIEGLLQTAAEKKRLEEELRIARQIQMSLLPRGPLSVPGLGITALCVPAREVGGDYYDFFPLSEDRLGVLIADVSGKGTSAALYMAELKGLVLALSQSHHSPRALLIEVNRIISEHLDSRSFITMTYAVIDLKRGAMTYCRAGHTPLIYLPGVPASVAQVLTPSGMVLGLRIDGAAEKFTELLEEERIDLSPGDVVVFYTDGISEAMNADSDLFGESRLGRLVEEHGHLETGELRERILRELEAFVGTADQHDDMTMILLKVEPAFAAQVAV